MKKILFSLLVLAVVSCSKKQDGIQAKTETNKEESVINSYAREVSTKPTYNETKEAYYLLKDEEKSALWLAKYNKILEQDASILTAEQTAIIVELKGLIQNENGGLTYLREHPEVGNNWMTLNQFRLQAHFTAEQIHLITEDSYFPNNFTIADSYAKWIYHPNNPHHIPGHGDDDGGGLDAPNCTCSYSYYCWAGQNGRCETGRNDCEKEAKCGLLGSSNCTGMCDESSF